MAAILVCDDDKEIVEAISIYLEQEGHQILKAYDGQQALSILEKEKVDLLIKYLRGMNDELNIPHCIKNYGADSYPTEEGFVPEEVFLERLPEVAKNAIGDACTGSNPRIPTQEEMEKLLKCCYYDTEVDF